MLLHILVVQVLSSELLVQVSHFAKSYRTDTPKLVSESSQGHKQERVTICDRTVAWSRDSGLVHSWKIQPCLRAAQLAQQSPLA